MLLDHFPYRYLSCIERLQLEPDEIVAKPIERDRDFRQQVIVAQPTERDRDFENLITKII